MGAYDDLIKLSKQIDAKNDEEGLGFNPIDFVKVVLDEMPTHQNPPIGFDEIKEFAYSHSF